MAQAHDMLAIEAIKLGVNATNVNQVVDASLVGLGVLLVLGIGAGVGLLAQHQHMRQERARFKTLFELSPEPMLILEHCRFSDCNQAALNSLGYADKSLVQGCSPVDHSPEYQHDGQRSDLKAARILREVMAVGGQAQCFEWQHLSADGRILTIDVSLAPAQLDGRTVVLCVWHDITERKQAQQALTQSENQLRTIIQTTPRCVRLVTRSGKILTMNPAGLAMIEADDPQQAIGQSIYPFVAPPYLAAFMAFNERVCDGATETIEFELIGLKGARRWMETLATPFPTEQVGEKAQLSLTQDITERKQVHAQLQLAASVFSHAREGILITTAQGDIIDVNDSFSRITGYTRAEVLGRNPRLLQSGRHTLAHYQSMWHALLSKGHWVGEVWNRRKSGEVFAEMLTISAVRDDAGVVQNYVALFTDITVMKAQQQQLEHIAHYDALTGLPNRLLLADRLSQAMAQTQRRKQSMALVFLDLDGFKAVNDQHGHDVGDELLIILSQRMKLALREGDTLSRIGGDEFVALLVDLESPPDYLPVLDRLLQAAADLVVVGPAVLHVSASLGVALYPQHGLDADALLRCADHAMYQAKQAGKNRYCLYDVQ